MRLRPGPITGVFAGVMFVALVVLMLFPQIALWLQAVLTT
jgi:hypothetical protein